MLACCALSHSAAPSWAYDAAGNRADSVVDALSRATSVGGQACTNDALGNRLSKPGATYEWDCLSRLVRFTPFTVGTLGQTDGVEIGDEPAEAVETGGRYRYRADGMRVSKSAGGVATRYRHDGQMGVEDVEASSSGTTVTRYGLGARGVDLIERTAPNGAVTTGFPVYDAHGNSVATLSRSGAGGFTMADRRSYDAWGQVRAQQSGGDPKLRYCANLGHRQDDESGLIYMRARYYEPGSGRFISEDSKRSSPNYFTYCASDPVNHWDKDGKVMWGWIDLLAFFADTAAYVAFLVGGEITLPVVALIAAGAVLTVSGSILTYMGIRDMFLQNAAENRSAFEEMSTKLVTTLKANGDPIAGHLIETTLELIGMDLDG